MPNRLLNPSEAGALEYSPVIQRVRTPPRRAEGRLSRISVADRVERGEQQREDQSG